MTMKYTAAEEEIAAYLKDSGAWQTYHEIADALKLNVNTASSSLSTLTRKSAIERGVGVYARKEPGQQARVYGYCEGYPSDMEGLVIRKIKPQASERPVTQGPASLEEVHLYRIDDVVTDGHTLWKLVPVKAA